MSRTYELMSEDGRKSFYGKAVVIEDGDKKYLRSYNTIVASIDKKGEISRLWDGWSKTTGRHLRAFCGISKKDWDKMEVRPE